ncbi:28S ribosomal protein S2, mitochondrial [Platysternon megacephalum]|uniref:28S ribosomal protein S2, mitochondrial n=1 Tax=Platysternon megacephalum TaxID=55544 RepID=A0A4D9EFF2_9SAUR|nr:28S ribosomal protein S2, mitochondrial [Platysternon megacephalum]
MSFSFLVPLPTSCLSPTNLLPQIPLPVWHREEFCDCDRHPWGSEPSIHAPQRSLGLFFLSSDDCARKRGRVKIRAEEAALPASNVPTAGGDRSGSGDIAGQWQLKQKPRPRVRASDFHEPCHRAASRPFPLASGRENPPLLLGLLLS